MENTFLDNLIKHYERYVFTIVRQQWNTKAIDPLLMEDVMQEIWLRCLKSQHTMEAFDELQTKAYLSAIARNTTRSFLKKQRKTVLFYEGEEEKLPELSYIEEYDNAVYHSIAALPNGIKEVILLKYVAGLTRKEIAAQLNISTVTVTNRIKKARQLLAKEWNLSDPHS